MKLRIRLTPVTRRTACEAVMAAKEGDTVTIQSLTRSLNQNAKLHAMCADIARQLEWAGSKRSAEDWKNELKCPSD